MTINKLKELISQDESPKLDFKREFWNKNMPQDIINSKKDELVRDIFALTNGDVYSINETAYLIIGVVDTTKEIYGFSLSSIGMVSIEKFKKWLLNRLNDYAQPEFLSLDIEPYNIDDKQVLVISIPPHEKLVSLSKNLHSFDKKGTTYYRIGEEIHIASSEVIQKFNKIHDNKSKNNITTKTYIENINNTGTMNFS